MRFHMILVWRIIRQKTSYPLRIETKKEWIEQGVKLLPLMRGKQTNPTLEHLLLPSRKQPELIFFEWNKLTYENPLESELRPTNKRPIEPESITIKL